MLALSPTMEEGVILGWKKNVGDTIATGDVLCEVETDKASMEYESNQNGEILAIVKDKGESARVGDVIAILGKKGEDITSLLASSQSSSASSSATDTQKAEESAAPQHDVSKSGGRPSGATDGRKASPLARRLAEQRGIDLSLVQGSGPSGRVIKRDIESFVPTAQTAGSTLADTETPVVGTRAVIARRLAESKFSAPHYYLKVSIDMTEVIRARAQLNKVRKNSKVGMNAFFLKFIAEALKRHPSVNASWEGDVIRTFGSIDIGTAVDRGNGLITPIVRNCGNKGVVDIDAELGVLIEKVNDGKLRPEEYTGATFTISNLGSFGVEEFSAIINPPGAAILAIGQTIPKPIVNDEGDIVVRPIMKVTLSCDHRVIDGAEAGRFIADLKAVMEYPARVLF